MGLCSICFCFHIRQLRAPAYPRVSEIIRNNVSAAVAGSKSVDAALNDMKRDLEPLLK